jgi:phosphate-starvation-inducible protein E
VVIVIALSRLAFTVSEALIVRSLNPLEHEVFRLVFGEILTLLIALEFNRTLQYVITRAKGIVQVRVVIIMSDCPRSLLNSLISHLCIEQPGTERPSRIYPAAREVRAPADPDSRSATLVRHATASGRRADYVR